MQKADHLATLASTQETQETLSPLDELCLNHLFEQIEAVLGDMVSGAQPGEGCSEQVVTVAHPCRTKGRRRSQSATTCRFYVKRT
jgi:hypothetical protein